jgi:nucleotide-binding universal stress UspA family protein
VPWAFRYLAGRPDRALTHLARAVDASAFVIGTRAPGPGSRMREAMEGSVAVRLTHHQHRPVLIVPLEVIDWKASHWS